MYERSAGIRQQEAERLQEQKLQEYADRVANTSIPVDHQSKSILRKEIRLQARLELTEIEMDEIERLWKTDSSFPYRKPSTINTAKGNYGINHGGNQGAATAAVKYGENVKQALELKLNKAIATNQFIIDTSKKPVFEGNKYPDMPVDPGTYAHLFEDNQTDYSRISTGERSIPDYGDDDY